jgi:hypothetical protein
MKGGNGNVTDEEFGDDDITATTQQKQCLPVNVCGELELHGSDFAHEVTDESRPNKERRRNTPQVWFG